VNNRKVTAMDVARLAGVSQSSVSRAFSKSSSVTEKKREAIFAAAEKLGYKPNAIARGLIMNKTNIIGIVMRDIKNPFYPEVLEKFYTQLTSMGYQLLFINSTNEEIDENEVSRLIEYSVEGVIITDALLTSSAVERFVENGISVVLFNRYIPGSNCSAVYCNNYSAGKSIGKYLMESGHRFPAFISGPNNTSTNIDRQKGFQEALLEGGVSTLIVKNGHYTYEGGYNAATDLLNDYPQVDCIFCGNDISAYGAMDAIKALGRKIPEDISIVGFDDVETSSWSSYALTTWQQPVDEMIKQSINLLMEEIEETKQTQAFIELEGKLIERKSVFKRRN
jgi:DNA-binding LacI/PurR family transcriptional regulator